ncbi:MAG TPA: MaoC/PaaZ C-terminal domain-containing protein [Microbacterium sp.]|nr:MaoC/PaaZ C-terminal domain-containing protein [Microbacterium sp.]
MRVQSRYFEDFRLGEVRTFLGRTVTESDIVLHAGQTGDFFPHHMDAEWCRTQSFGQRIAHGTLILSIGVGMTADDVNPEATSYGYDRIRFVRPVFIGDTITVRAEVTAMSDHARRPDELGRLDETVTVTNQHGDVVLSLVHLYVINKKGEAA